LSSRRRIASPNTGSKKYYSDWRFTPGYRDGEAPFGEWAAAKAYVLAEYVDGTAPCNRGVVCRDDVAVLALQPLPADRGGPFPGVHTGWFGYVSGQAPFTQSGLTHVTQLGYPGCLDWSQLMQRNDAQAAISPGNHDNTIFGSLMCEGSSGGPWLANFGIAPVLTDTVAGEFEVPNVIIGVTSWGYRERHMKQQGASPLLSVNIDALVAAACKEHPAACK
jgi:hypothetical protein